MNEPFYEVTSKNYMRVFDKRGIFLIINDEFVYMWVGSRVAKNVKEL